MHQYFSADFRIINNKNILLYHIFSVHSPTRVLFLNTAQRKEVSQHIQEAVIPPSREILDFSRRIISHCIIIK